PAFVRAQSKYSTTPGKTFPLATFAPALRCPSNLLCASSVFSRGRDIDTSTNTFGFAWQYRLNRIFRDSIIICVFVAIQVPLRSLRRNSTLRKWFLRPVLRCRCFVALLDANLGDLARCDREPSEPSNSEAGFDFHIHFATG